MLSGISSSLSTLSCLEAHHRDGQGDSDAWPECGSASSIALECKYGAVFSKVSAASALLYRSSKPFVGPDTMASCKGKKKVVSCLHIWLQVTRVWMIVLQTSWGISLSWPWFQEQNYSLSWSDRLTIGIQEEEAVALHGLDQHPVPNPLHSTALLLYQNLAFHRCHHDQDCYPQGTFDPTGLRKRLYYLYCVGMLLEVGQL